MVTESDRITILETKLDGFIEETRSRLNDMNARMNVQFQVTVAMWLTTMAGVLTAIGISLAVLLKV